jgi:hypothetical protein
VVAGIAAPAHAADQPELFPEDFFIPDSTLAKQGMVEFPNAPFLSPPDFPPCEVFKNQRDATIAAGAQKAHAEWHTADAAFTLGQTLVIPTGKGEAAAQFKVISKKSFAECIEAMNGEDDENPLVDVNVEVKKSKTKIKGADKSAVYWVESTYDPTTGPASYGRSATIFVLVQNAIVDFVFSHFSMDQGELDEFEDEAKPYLSAIRVQMAALE